MPIINEIKAVKSLGEFNSLCAKYYQVFNMLGFYDIGAISDAAADATKWCAVIVPGQFYLGSRDYYADDESLAGIHEAAINYIADVYAYIGETGDLVSRARAVFKMEQGNALASMPMELLNNPDVIYTKSSWDEMDKVTAASGVLSYSPEIREALKNANVYCPDMDYIKYADTNYTEANLSVLKDFAIFNTMQTFGMLIGDDFAELTKDLQTALYGEPIETMELGLRAQMLVTNLMDDAFSKLYAEKFATSAVKKDVTQIIGLIREKYRERIDSLDWMSGETKEKAIEKLDAIKTFAVYPDKYKTKYTFDVKSRADGGNLIDFYTNYKISLLEQIIDEISGPYIHSLWDDVPTYTVNAFYSPNENAIIIPAGILQAPFYFEGGNRETNLGGIGAVIAHEISHAFDNNGAKYDKNGTIINWWTDDDYAAFDELTKKVAADLSKINFVGDLTVNGVLCTGETIADLGAMACVLDIADDSVGADLKTLMRSWANIWAAKMSPEVSAYLLSVDVHAPNKVRTNFVLSQQDAFHDVFGVSESDGMYTPPENRIVIW
jgi:putative endopeptidase